MATNREMTAHFNSDGTYTVGKLAKAKSKPVDVPSDAEQVAWQAGVDAGRQMERESAEARLRGADERDAPWAEWMECESRRPFVVNGLRDNAEKMRAAEKRVRDAYKNEFMRVPCQYVAVAYGKAAAVFEAQLVAIDAAIAQQTQENQ